MEINPLHLALRYGFEGQTEDGYHLQHGMLAPWQAIKRMSQDRSDIEAENAALKAELAAAQDDLAALRLFAANLDATHNATLKEMQITMRQELAAAKKDAERLAFVESRAYVGVNPHTKTCLWVLRGIYELPGQCFRAAIDKAMEGEQK